MRIEENVRELSAGDTPLDAPGPGSWLAGYAARVRADVPLFVLDGLLCLGAYMAVLVMRFDGNVPSEHWTRFWAYVPAAVAFHLVANWLWHLYGQIWTYASVQEARRVILAGVSAVVPLIVTQLTRSPRVPSTIVVLGGVTATLLMGGIRFQSRLFSLKRGGDRNFGIRVAVIGAGESGAAIVREMLRNPRAGLQPVVILDDDPRKHGRSLLGIPIVGAVSSLSVVAPRHRVHQALLAVDAPSKELMGRAASAAAAADLALKVFPGLGELARGKVSMADVRNLEIEDLLGRQQVDTDLDAVRRLLAGRRVLVTGGGGSIGSEIVRQVASCHPAALFVLDHDETLLYDVAQRLPEVVQVLADVRDSGGIDRIFQQLRPEIVFHAAAHKHVPILEEYACEAAATNVFGTANVVQSANRVGVEHLVVISTDKAVQPSSVMGASKWLSEQVMLAMAPADRRYCAVRFGNVLGSRGSVLPTFSRQIAEGGPVTVTHYAMTRFFMSIKEAVQLVLQAAALAEGREVFMLEMGSAVNILDVAKRMIRLSGHEPGTDIPIRLTGMRPGEKLVEELRAPGEKVEPTLHPSILRLRPVTLPRPHLDEALEQLEMATSLHRHDEAAALLRALPFEVPGPGSDVRVDVEPRGRVSQWSPSNS